MAKTTPDSPEAPVPAGFKNPEHDGDTSQSTTGVPQTRSLPSKMNLSSGYYDRPRVKIVSSTHQEKPKIPVPIWLFIVLLISSALIVILLKTDAEPPKPDEEFIAATPIESDQLEETTSVKIETPKAPLDFSESFLKAELEARRWSSKAMLSLVSLSIENRELVGALNVEYGEAVGHAVPGAPLTTKRMKFTIVQDSISSQLFNQASERKGLPQPNCPLEVAFYELNKVATNKLEALQAFYYFAPKYNRPVWQFKKSSGDSYFLDANDCRVFTR